ncbi:MAG: SDR family oxidoreductase [Ignavibacteria bacterium]|nr:SDR family oxidoreductase [Ignavibacteria bacterium]
MNLGLENKTAIVMAASKGLGKACAEALAQEGCQVMISSRNKENLISTALELSANSVHEVLWSVCDVRNPDEIKSTIDQAFHLFNRVDILVNNCGGPPSALFDAITDEQWQSAFDEILLSVIRTSREVLYRMRRNNFGRIINITSVSVKQPIQRLMLSNSLRSAVIGFAKTLSTEVAPFNITVNNIAPGYTLTARLYELAIERAKSLGRSHEEILNGYIKDIPMGRMARPEEIGSLCAFLASEKASYITGQTIAVDGGYTKNIM